jgi:cellulose synthase/poly-beta-1,6-N-acetylglucosamine synthase-like glycosyltransferase
MVTANPALEIITVLSWLLAVVWLAHAIIVVRGMVTLPDVTGNGAHGPFATDEDQITVIVPARDEEASIENTLRSLLASTGVRLQIIAVNDRSTDATGLRMDEVAAEAAAAARKHTLSVLHITELPDGWLGKPHAMALAARQARSPWVLFTDGDVLFHPRALEIALHEAEAHSADHLVLAPTVILEKATEKAMLATMNMLSQGMVRLWKVSDPRARDFIGVGGFNLIRRDVYEKLGGFDALRMEVLDDMRLGWLVKRAGYRQRVIVGRDLMRLRWLRGALDVIHLAEKNGFAAFRYRVVPTLLASLGLFTLAVLPLIAVAAGGWPLVAGLLAYLSVALTFWGNRKVTPVPPWLAVLYAPATLVVLFALLRSMTLALVRRGIDWRGTRYSLGELRRNAGRGWRS